MGTGALVVVVTGGTPGTSVDDVTGVETWGAVVVVVGVGGVVVGGAVAVRTVVVVVRPTVVVGAEMV